MKQKTKKKSLTCPRNYELMWKMSYNERRNTTQEIKKKILLKKTISVRQRKS
jgi:hypothetical protein